MDMTPYPRKVRFGAFETDPRAGELRKHGIRIKLQNQPFQLLMLLIEKPGEMVTREEIQAKLWPADTFVDFEVGLNTAIGRLRGALGDTADSPRYSETLPKRGYRFLLPTEPIEDTVFPTPPNPVPPPSFRVRYVLAAAVLLLLAVGSVAVRRWLWPPPRSEVHSIAVLPFDNLSGDSLQDYFSKGITDAMITTLAQIHSFRVISLKSSIATDPKQPLPEIAKQLGVDYVLIGAVMLSGNQLRLNAQLIYGPTDRHLWAKSYQRELTGIFSLQNELAQTVAAEIRVKLTSEEKALFATARPVNPEAHLLYLKGMYHWYQGTPGAPEEFELSRQFFQKAVAADPTYAFGYSGLAYYYSIAADVGLLPAADAWPRWKAAGQKARELDPRLGVGILAVSSLYRDLNWPVAEAQFKEAIRLWPSEPDWYREYSIYLRTMHRCDEAIEQMRKAQEIDPLTSGMRTTMGWTYYYCRRYDLALDQFRRAVLLDKDSLDAHFGVAKAYEYKGQEAEAIAAWELILNMNGDADLAAAFRRTFTASGYRAAMRMLWRTQLEDLQDEARRKEVASFRLATPHALLGQKDQAFNYLEAAFQEHSTKLLDVQLDADFDNLHSDPRFNQLVRRIGLPP